MQALKGSLCCVSCELCKTLHYHSTLLHTQVYNWVSANVLHGGGEGVEGKWSLVEEEIENLLINNELPCTDLVTELINSLIYFILISNNFMVITNECPV